MKLASKLWVGIAVLAALSPLGLLLPEYFKAGKPWGEEKLVSLWNAPMPDYAFKGWGGKGLSHLSVAYVLSAVAGILMIVVVTLLIGKVLVRRKD